MDSKAYWVGFNHVKGIGSVRLKKIIDFFGSLEIAWDAPIEAYLSLGFTNSIIERFLSVRKTIDLEQKWEEIHSKGIEVIIWDDDNYPRRLKEIEQPPPVLYIKGKILEEDDWAVAVVGTRRKTIYGSQMAERISSFLSANGICIVSGLARGIDTISHNTALGNNGRTIAVLGCGVDRIYPPENKKLAMDIINNGALVSDYPPGTPPEGNNFPPRNRIISGIAKATIVIEAGKKSGAIITAKFAADQGREVFAVPGNINSPQSGGTNWLIQQGARPLVEFNEILEILEFNRKGEYFQARKTINPNGSEKDILNVLGNGALHIDEILNRTDLSIDVVSSTLAIMELKGIVRNLGGKNYCAINEVISPYGRN